MISVLFAARNSVYKTIPGLDVWDEDRDALNWPGGNPGIFHPPCRLFCALKHLSTAPESEKELAYWAIEQVRKWGGVLEHPAYSMLWKDQCLPKPGCCDEYGFTFGLDQFWFGNRARKRTWLYCVGTTARELPVVPIKFGHPDDIFVGGDKIRKRQHPRDSRSDLSRSGTPPAFAHWLIAVAERCNVGRLAA